jgi:hypothetical protein
MAALDAGRLNLSNHVPLALSVIALVMYIAGSGFQAWEMSVNSFYSPVIHVQAELAPTPHYLLFELILQSKENQLKLPTPPKKPGVSITNCKMCTPAGRLTPGTLMVCQICQSLVVNKVMGPLKL